MLNNYADSGGGFNSNHGQTARPTETQKQQNLGAPWGPYNSQLEGFYYSGDHQPMYMGSYEGSTKHSSYPQYPSGTLHQPVPTPAVQCYDTCCQHYENRYPLNPAPLRYQPSGPLQPRYSDIPSSDSRQYFPDRRPVQVNLPRKKVYPAENGYAGMSDSHYPQYMGRGQALPVDSRQQMQVIRPQYTGVYPPYWGSSRGWAGARMNCPPPSYHQSINQSAQLQPGTKLTDNSQYIDPLQKSLSAQHQRGGVSSSSGKLDIIRPVPEPKRPTLDSNSQSCYEYGYPTGFLPFSEVSKIHGKSLNPQSMNVPCKAPAEKQYHPQQMQYSYQNNERNLISYGNPSNDPSYTMNFPLSSNDIHARPDLEEGQQASNARKLSMHYDSSDKKRQNLDVRQFIETWEDDEDESARLSEPPLPVESTATPYIVIECSSLESEAAAKLQERFKSLPSSQDYLTKPRGSSPSSEHKRSNEQPRQEERTERTIVHSDLHSQTSYAPSMPTLLSDSDKNVNFWNGINKESDSVIGKGGAFQPLDCSKRDSNINPKVVSQRDALPPRDMTAHKVLCNTDPNSSFDALVSFYGNNRRVSGEYDLVEMSERLINSSDKARINYQPSEEIAKPCDPRLQQSQHSNNPSIYDKLSPRFSTNNYDHLKNVTSDPYYNYKHPVSSGEKYYSFENSPIINSNYDYNKFVSEFDNTRLYGNKEAPKDPRRVLQADSKKNSENSVIEGQLSKSSMPNCFKDKTSLEYTSLESEKFLSPIIVKSTDNLSEPCSQKSIAIEDTLNKQQTNFSNILSKGIESQAQSEKTVLVTSQSSLPEIFKEMDHKDNVVTLHSGDQTKNNTMTVEVPYDQGYSSLVKLSEEISRTDSVDENERRALALTHEDKTATEEIKKSTCFKLKRLPNSKEWAVEGNESTESGGKEGISSPKSPEVIEDSDILKTSVSVSNLNMPSLDDIRDGEENCEITLENHSKLKVSEVILCPNKTSAQPPQLAIVQPMKLVSCQDKSHEPNLQNELNSGDTNTKQALKIFRSFHSHNLSGSSFSSAKPVTVTDCDSQIDVIKSDISKHENFRSHKKIQGNFSESFPNEGFSHSQGVSSETTKQFSPFHMYVDCEVNSQIPDFFKMDQRSSSNEKMLDKQRPTSPGVEEMFEDINHSTNNQLCHNQMYQRKSCNFQDLTGPSISSFDNHNSHFQSFSNIFADDSNNKGRCDGSVLHMGDKKYLKNLLDDIEREQVSNSLEERVSKLKSNFFKETSNDKTCEAKKSPPIPPINLKLSESKKVWCITNKDQHLSLSDFSENGLLSLPSKSEKEIPLTDNKKENENYLMQIPPEETNQSCCRNEDVLLPSDKNLNDIDACDKMEIESPVNQLSSEAIDEERSPSGQTPIIIDIDKTSAEFPIISGFDPTKNPFSKSISQSTTDFINTTCNEENHCLSIVKYYPRFEILKGKFPYNIDSNISPNILIFDEKGRHFPSESNGEDSHDVEVKSIAKDIVDLLVTNVVFSREIIDCLGNEHVSISHDKFTEQEKASSTCEENLETVIKFDKSSSSSKSVNEQKHITKTTEIFIEHEKAHNKYLSVIKAVKSEKYFCSVDERKIFRSIFSPMPDDGKDNNPISLYNSPSVTNHLTDKKNPLNFDITETEDNSEKMDVDVIENSDDNQPLDYSIGDLTTYEGSSSHNRSTSENVISSDSSLDSDNSNGKVFNDKELGTINCCPVDLYVSNNTSNISENNNSKSFSIKQINKSTCSKDQPIDTVLVCETDVISEESKNNYQLTNLNCENRIVDDNFSSHKSDFESDFDISDSEPTNDKETIAKEAIDFMSLSNEKLGSNCILKNELLQTACCNKEKESGETTDNKTQEIKGQSFILKVDSFSPKLPSIAPAIFTKDNLVNKSVELNSKSTNQGENFKTKEIISLDNYIKDTNTESKESNCCSLGNMSENPSDNCPLKSSQEKFEESLSVTSSLNHLVSGGSSPKFHKDERSETSVIVRNNTFTVINNNHSKQSSSSSCDKIESNDQNKCDFSTSKSMIVNQEIPDILPNNYKESLSADLKENSCEDDISNPIYDNVSEECKLMTKVSNHEDSISDKGDGDESMETESCCIVQTPVIPIAELRPVNNVATKNLEEGINLKLSYCVCESIFLNMDEESLLCSEKSSSSYLFDFKRRKLLKFCKSVVEPKLSFSKNITNYNRDSSTVQFGMNQQVCPSSVVIHAKSYPMSEKSHYSNAQIHNNYKVKGSTNEVNSAQLSQFNDNITDPLKSSFDPPETSNPLYTVNINKKPTVIELKSDHSEEDSAVLKPNKHMVLLKSKLSFSQEITSFCVRRDPLKILEPEAVLKEIFSPDPDVEGLESKENYLSANHSKDKLKTSNNAEKFSLAPVTCSSLATLRNDPSLGTKWNSINSSSQNIADVNFNLLNSDKEGPSDSTNLDVCVSDVNSEICYKAQSKPTDEKDESKPLSHSLKTNKIFKNNICKEQSPLIGADLLDDKTSLDDQQNAITSSFEDCNSLDTSCKELSKSGTESCRYFTDSLTPSDEISLLYPRKSVECCDQTATKMQDEDYYVEECCESKITNTEPLSQEDQRTTECLTGPVPQNMQRLSCQISNVDNHVNHTNDSEKSISSMSIVTGRDVLFSSRFLEDEEDKELNSELQTENRSRKSSVEEESILDCQNMKVNSQDSLRGGGHLNSETFPLQYLVEAALAVENVDSKQMLLSSSSFSGIYSQSSQSLIKSTIGDVHPNDIEDFPEKNTFSSSSSDPNICKMNKLSPADQEIFSKFEENNYNLRASTRIVTSSSSNIIPYSKRYYRLKSKKLPKAHPVKINKSENSIKKSQCKKRKDVFTYPRSKRRKKGIKEKPKYQQPKKQLDFHKITPGNNFNQVNHTYDSTQNCESKLIFEEPHGSSNNQRKEKEDCFQSPNTNRFAENYNSGSHQSLSGKSNFGGPLIIASENSPVESNIFCVHVNSDKMDEYVHDLNVGGLELLSEHNQSVFKENSIEEQSETPDATMENGTSLVIIIEELGENGEKDNYYNSCKDSSDSILDSMDERSTLPQPNSILDYCSDNLTSEVSINESCICPSNFDNGRNRAHSLFKDSTSPESECSMTYRSYGINSGKFDKFSSECNQDLLTTNCYEEINETLVNDIGNWPFVEEEVAEFNTKSVSPNRIPEEGRKIELKCSLPWNKIFNMDKTKKKKNKMSHKVSGLELGPAKVEVRLRAPSTEWKVISDYAENSSPVVKVSRLILQRESETSSYSEKDSEEENENRKLLSPSHISTELKHNSNGNDISMNLIEYESWQPVVLLTRNKELDELTRSKTTCKELDEVTQSKTRNRELLEFSVTLDSPLNSDQSTFTGFSSQDNEDVNKDNSESESSEIVGEENEVDSSEQSKSSENLQTNVKNVEKDLFEKMSEKNNAYSNYQNAKAEKGCSYETYSPSRHDGSQADETIYSPSDPHYSPEPGYLYSDSSSFGDTKKSDFASESNTSDIENRYNQSFNTFNKDNINKENDLHKSDCGKRKSYLFSGSPENVNFQDSETSDTNYSSEISSLYDGGRNNLAETNSLSHGEVHLVNNQYVRPDLLDTPNIISNETRKSDLRKSVAVENLKKFKRKMPKNFFVRRKSRKNAEHKSDATENILLEEKCEQGKPSGSLFLTDSKSCGFSTEFALTQRRLPNSSVMDSIPNEWQTGPSSALMEERLSNTSSDLSFVCENSRLPCLDDSNDSFPMRLNDSPINDRFEEKLRLRDGGRGLKRPCEGHSKEDTKRRRQSLSNHSNKCQECEVQFETKEELSRHTVQNHAATRELHHCLLCQRSFSSETRHRLHMQGRRHRHLELTQRHTIHAVHRLLVGEDCPRIPPLSQSELQALQWRPAQPGYSHFYSQLTPLQMVLQEHNSEAIEEMAAGERRMPND